MRRRNGFTRKSLFTMIILAAAVVFAAHTFAADGKAPTVSILDPRPGTSLSPSIVSPRPQTNDFRVQVQVWDDVAVTANSVQVGYYAGATPDAGTFTFVTAALNTNHVCGAGCGVYEATISGLTADMTYYLYARASSSEGLGESRQNRTGNDARYVAIRFVAPKTGTGMLLVRDSSSQLCLDCHNLPSHSSQTLGAKYQNWQTVCLDCHTAHATRNIFLVKETIVTPNSGSRSAAFYNTAGDAVNSYVTATSGASTKGICQVCHTQTKNQATLASRWTNTGNADASHYQAPGTQRCTDCHSHTSGFAPSGACKGCHNTTRGARRKIVESTPGDGTGDFVKSSRHVSNGTTNEIVTDFDCIVCHAEGDTGSSGTNIKAIGSLHPSSSSPVKLRNVDNAAAPGSAGTLGVNYWAWPGTSSATTTDRNNMDVFCLNCHDQNGASGINVRATDDGLNLDATRATTPFNSADNLRNNRDRLTTRTRVIDVKGQFYAGTGGSGAGYNGNPSQHGLVALGPGYNTGGRYSTQNAGWAGAWTATHTLRSGVAISSANGKDRATLHCADCHLTETNAHGATNAWHLLLSGTVNDWTSDTIMGGQASSVTAAVVCYKCHRQTVYDTNGSNKAPKQDAGSRINHYDIDSNAHVTYGSAATNPAGAGAQLGPFCLLCHAGDGPGLIHGRGSATDGDNTPYNPGGSSANGTYTKYRFLPGAWQMWKPGTAGNDTDFTAARAGTCYFQSAGETVSSCQHHQAGGSATGQTTNYGRNTVY